MSLERNFSLKLVRVTSPGYFRSSKFSSDTSWSSASEEAKEWAAGSDCKKPAGRGFNRRRGRAPSPGRGTGTLQSVVHIGCIWRLLSLYWGGRWPAPQTQKTSSSRGWGTLHLRYSCHSNRGLPTPHSVPPPAGVYGGSRGTDAHTALWHSVPSNRSASRGGGATSNLEPRAAAHRLAGIRGGGGAWRSGPGKRHLEASSLWTH